MFQHNTEHPTPGLDDRHRRGSVYVHPTGLIVIDDFFADDQQAWLLRWIDAQPWDATLRRRTQHYGVRYSYDRRPLTDADRLGPVPAPLLALGTRIAAALHVPNTFDQFIVNEYLVGQRISAHVDHVQNFGPVVATLSLGEPGCLRFSRAGTVVDVSATPGSLLGMTAEARYRFTHETLPAVTRRVSVTARCAIITGR